MKQATGTPLRHEHGAGIHTRTGIQAGRSPAAAFAWRNSVGLSILTSQVPVHMNHDLPFQPGHAAHRAPLVHGIATGLFRLCALGLLAGGATIHPVARTPWVSGRVTGSPYPPAPYKAEQVHTGLAFENPLDIALAPGTGRLFIAEQGGRIWSFDTRSEHAKPDLALDLDRKSTRLNSSH